MLSLFFRLLAIAWFAFLASSARGADIKRIIHPQYDLVLEGTIAPGDYEKLIKFIGESCPDACPSAIYLASPGGSLAEAIKIGRLVRAMRLKTQVPDNAPQEWRQKFQEIVKLANPKKNYLCTSACFFIAVAGIERSAESFFESTLLGVHRPYLSDSDLKILSADQALSSAAGVRLLIDSYLKEMGVPSKYLDLMFSVPKERVRWISDLDFQSDLEGFIPEFKDWLDAQCGASTEAETRFHEAIRAKLVRREKLNAEEEVKRSALAEKTSAIGECWAVVLPKMQQEAWKAYSDRKSR